MQNALQPEILINYSLLTNEATSNRRGWVESFQFILNLLTSQIVKSTEVTISIRQDFSLEELNKAYMEKISAYIIVTGDSQTDEGALKIHKEWLQSKNDSAQTINIRLSDQNGIQDGIQKIYDLFETNSEGGYFIWNPDSESEDSKSFWLKIVDLAYELAQLFKREKRTYHKTVFLAETTADASDFRNQIRRDLNRHGYQVLPEGNLPSNEVDLMSSIENILSTSAMSIHIVGKQYGEQKFSANTSLVDLQNKVAAKFCKKNKTLSRLIWIAEDSKITDLRQGEYLDNLKKNKEDLEGAELLQVPIEILKSIILRKLDSDKKSDKQNKKTEKKSVIKEIPEGGTYIIYDIFDRKEVEPILEWFNKKKLTYTIPDFDLLQGYLLEDHKRKLISADSVMIFCGNANIQWSRAKLNDILKAPGYGRVKSFEKKCIYIAHENHLVLKDQYDNSSFKVIINMKDFSPSILEQVLV